MSVKKLAGRPSSYSEEMADKICSLIAEDFTYEKIAALEGMPSKSTIMEWLRTKEDFRTRCAHAKEIQADAIDNRIGDVLDKTEVGTLTPDVARVMLSGLQWRASKKDPKKYGDRQQIDLDAKHSYEKLTEEQLDAEIKRHAAEAGVSLAVSGKGEAEE